MGNRKPKLRTQRINVRVSKEVRAWVVQQASQRHIDISDVVRDLLELAKEKEDRLLLKRRGRYGA